MKNLILLSLVLFASGCASNHVLAPTNYVRCGEVALGVNGTFSQGNYNGLQLSREGNMEGVQVSCTDGETTISVGGDAPAVSEPAMGPFQQDPVTGELIIPNG